AAACGAAATHYAGARWQFVVLIGLMMGIWLLTWVYLRRRFTDLVTFILTFTMPMKLNLGLWELSGPLASGMPMYMTLWDKDILLMILACDLCMDAILRRSRPTTSLGWVWVWLGIMSLSSMFFSVNSVNPSRSLALWIEWHRFMLIFVYLARYVQSRRMVRWIVLGILAQIWIESGIALAQYFAGGKLGLTFLGETRVKEMIIPGGALIRSGALMGHPNAFALWLVLVSPLPLALALKPDQPFGRKLALWATYALGTIVLIMTFSRAGWACGVLGLFMTYHYARRRFGKPYLVSIWVPFVFFASIGIALFLLSDDVRYRIVGEDTGSAFARIPQFMTAFNIIKGMPWSGTGLGSYAPYIHQFADFDGRYLSALFFRVHNGLLLWTAETGIFSGFAYVALWITVIRHGWGLWDLKDDFLALTGIAVMIGLFGWWIKSMYNIHTVNNDQTICLHFALVWMLWSASKSAPKKSRECP
ncbi:MAG: O-antigen ligase family protein, partial [Planctomycetes bacterium]|nr:O-antigen ligase family protein [Planctomycetota bacterium]